ncbi:hypothetical protein ON010_g18280 [Phytophthora cinnamomi]|nr:hypothetical protein ON010_g18280 [Phytophthora cinnamomi]
MGSGLALLLQPQPRCGLIHQVNGLIRHLALRQVPVGQRRGRHERAVGDPDAVVHLVLLLESAQDRDRVLDAGLRDEHGLEAPGQRRVLLDVLSVLVQRGGAHAVQRAASQRRFEHVGGVRGAFIAAGAHERVQLVDEEDHLALALVHVLQHGLEPLLELAAELGAGHERRQVQRHHLLVLEAVGHLPQRDALRQALGHRRLAHARLADQDRVVLGAARQDLRGAADGVLAPDDRVQVAGPGHGRQVAPVLGQALALRHVLRVDPGLRRAHGGQAAARQHQLRGRAQGGAREGEQHGKSDGRSGILKSSECEATDCRLTWVGVGSSILNVGREDPIRGRQIQNVRRERPMRGRRECSKEQCWCSSRDMASKKQALFLLLSGCR